MRRLPFLVLALILIAGCSRDRKPDAYGTFEADEVVVSAQTTGQLLEFTAVEGTQLNRGTIVAVVDTSQLALEGQQLVGQRAAATSRASEVTRQIEVLTVQRAIAERNYARTRRLFQAKAATAQQLDQAERDYRVLGAQIEAARAQRQSVAGEIASSAARVAQVRDRLSRSHIANPASGTVLATFVHTGEVVQPGQPLYRIASLDTLTLRAYVSETQLHAIRLGQQVQVHVDRGDGKLIALPGTISWISAKAEFTPTPVQTRDERADLVYAIKVLVPNTGGVLKIGMPADLSIVVRDTRA